MKEFTITAENEGQRFDKYLGRILNEGSMSFIFKMLRKKNFVLNDKKADGKEIIKAGDIVKLYISDDTYEKFRTKSVSTTAFSQKKNNIYAYNIENTVVYEDKDILLIDKPAGLLSQKSKKDDISINELIIDYLLNNNKITKEQILNYKPSVVNRLDRNTSGIIIAAKNLKTAQILSSDLKERTINKYYKCVVIGEFNINGKYTGFITKDKINNHVRITDRPIDNTSDYIETEYELLSIKEIDGIIISVVKVHLITGKSHQIRAHISYLGFPIVGDLKYGNKAVNKKLGFDSQLLHAYRIEFPEYDKSINFEFSGKVIECEPQFKL